MFHIMEGFNFKEFVTYKMFTTINVKLITKVQTFVPITVVILIVVLRQSIGLPDVLVFFLMGAKQTIHC